MKKYEFKPDRFGSNWFDRIYLSKQQQARFQKWALYGLICTLLLVLQDAAFSLFRPFGGTVDMLVAAILVICLLEDLQGAAKFALTASVLYVFSGSAPGYYVIVLITFLGVFSAVFRQGYLQEGFGAVLLCAGAATILYETVVFLLSLVLAKTYAGAWFRYVMTAVNTIVAILVMYPLLHAISKMGGQSSWRD